MEILLITLLILLMVIIGEILWYLDKRKFKKMFSPYIDISEYNNRYENYKNSVFLVFFAIGVFAMFLLIVS